MATGPKVSGQVWASDRTPASGAQVDLLPILPRAQASGRLLEGASGGEPLATATTDSQGFWALEAPVPGVYRLRVHADGHLAMQWRPLVLSSVPEGAADGVSGGVPDAESTVYLPPLPLRRAVDLTVRAIDAAARPLTEGHIWVTTADDFRVLEGWMPDDRVAWVDGQGRAVVARAAGEALDVSLLDPAGRSETRRKVLDSVIPLRLPPSGTWVREPVRVRDASGQPLAGVVVHGGSLRWPVGRTDAQGGVELWTRPDESLPLLLSTEAGFERRLQLHPAVDSEFAPRPLDLRLPAPLRFAAQVLDAERQPVTGAVVWTGRDPGLWTATDAEGRAQLPVVSDEDFWIQAEAQGHLPTRLRIPPEQLATARDGWVHLPPIVLEPSLQISGKVVTTDGQPIPGVHLVVAPSKTSKTSAGDTDWFRLDPALGRAQSDAKGRFWLSGLPVGGSSELLARHPGFEPLRVAIRGLKVSRSGLELELRASRSVYGWVADLEETPLADAVVVVTKAGSPLPARPPWLPTADGEPASLPKNAVRTDAEGHFHSLPITHEKVDLSAFRQGFQPTHVRGLEIPAVPTSDVGTLLMAPGLGLTGRVVDPSGEGIEGIQVHRVPEDDPIDQLIGDAEQTFERRPPATETGPEGLFRIDTLYGGERLHLLFRGEGYQTTWRRHLAVPTDALEVELEPAAVVRGRVIDEAGNGVAGAAVLLSWRKPVAEDLPESTAWLDERERETDAEGYFVFGDAPSGAAILHVVAKGYLRPEPRELELEAESEGDEVVIELEAGAILEGWVRTASGEGLQRAKVRTTDSQAITDAEGFYRMAGVRVGAETIEAHHPHHGRQSVEVEIEAGLNSQDFTYEDGYEIAGRVVSPSGEPIPRAAILLRGRNLRQHLKQSLESEPDGRFRLGPLTNGEYQIELDKPGHVGEPRFTTVRVDGAAVDDLRLVMSQGATIRGQVTGLDFEQLARVKIYAEAIHALDRQAVVDYEGRFEIHDLAMGDWRLRADLEQGRRETRRHVRLTPGVESAEVELAFTAGVRLDGRVLQDDEEVGGALVTLRGQAQAVDRSVVSDHQGEFLFEDLDPGTYRLEVVHARKHLVDNRDLDVLADRSVTIAFRPARLAGRVWAELDSETPPIDGAVIQLERQVELGGERNVLVSATDAEGGFFFPRVPAARYRMTVRKDGYAVHQEELVVEPSMRRDDLDVALQPTAGLRLVIDAAPSAPAQVTVAVVGVEGRLVLREVRSLGAGSTLDLPTLPPGRWRLLLTAPGHATTIAEVEVPSEPVTVVLPPGTRLHVVVPELTGSDELAELRLFGPAGSPLQTLDELAQPRQTWPVVLGRAVIDHVPAGQWTLLANTSSGRSVSATVEVDGFQERSIELR